MFTPTDSLPLPSLDMLELYKRYRKQSMAIVKEKIIKAIPKGVIKKAAKKLGFYEDKKIDISSERVLDVLLNYVIFHYVGNGHKVIERFTNEKKHLYNKTPDEIAILNSFSNRSYGLLFINKTLEHGAVDVTDILNKRQFLLMDEGLSMSAQSKMVVATECLHFSDFAITTGAALPLNACGKEVLSIADTFITNNENFCELSSKKQSRIITMITKTCIDANVLDNIRSFG